VLESDLAEECFLKINPLLDCFTKEEKGLAWLTLRGEFAKLEAAQHCMHQDEGDSSDEEEFTNPYLLSHEEADRAAALRR
jgi:hypothetical protein